MQMAASSLREKVIPGLDHCVNFQSIYDVEELELSHNPTITAFNECGYHPTDEDLDVKLPVTVKAQNLQLEDVVPSSR